MEEPEDDSDDSDGINLSRNIFQNNSQEESKEVAF